METSGNSFSRIHGYPANASANRYHSNADADISQDIERALHGIRNGPRAYRVCLICLTRKIPVAKPINWTSICTEAN